MQGQKNTRVGDPVSRIDENLGDTSYRPSFRRSRNRFELLSPETCTSIFSIKERSGHRILEIHKGPPKGIGVEESIGGVRFSKFDSRFSPSRKGLGTESLKFIRVYRRESGSRSRMASSVSPYYFNLTLLKQLAVSFRSSHGARSWFQSQENIKT